jgi:hypothetical protein
MNRHAIALGVGLTLAGSQALAAGNTFFDDVDPLTGANTPIPVGAFQEATNALLLPSGPGITLTQTSIADPTSTPSKPKS